MHQHPTQGHHVGLTRFITSGIDGLGKADFTRLRTAVDELGGILQNEDWSFARRAAHLEDFSQLSDHFAALVLAMIPVSPQVTSRGLELSVSQRRPTRI